MPGIKSYFKVFPKSYSSDCNHQVLLEKSTDFVFHTFSKRRYFLTCSLSFVRFWRASFWKVISLEDYHIDSGNLALFPKPFFGESWKRERTGCVRFYALLVKCLDLKFKIWFFLLPSSSRWLSIGMWPSTADWPVLNLRHLRCSNDFSLLLTRKVPDLFCELGHRSNNQSFVYMKFTSHTVRGCGLEFFC